MADKNSVSETGAISGEGEQVTTPEYVTKSEADALFRKLRELEKELKGFKASKSEPSPKEQQVEQTARQVDPEKEEMKKLLKQVLSEREQEKAELRTQKLNSTLADTLIQHGVDPRHVKHASTILTAQGAVKYDDDGNIKMNVGMLDYDLNEGIKTWTKSEDAKIFLAPKGAVGSGQKGNFSNGPIQKSDDKNAVWSEFAKALNQF